MKRLTGAVLIFSTTSTFAVAGGIDRSGQNIGPIFEAGNYAEFSFGAVSPDVSGSLTIAPIGSGDMSPSYNQLGFAYKHQFSDKLSAALIFDQPYGADVAYPAGPYPAATSTAEATSNALTALLRYKFNDNWSVHGGLRYQSFQAEAVVPFVAGYTGTSETEYGLGGVLGFAYERPDIAMRIALTYSSEISYALPTVETGAVPGSSTTNIETPQSVNLDFQTGIAEDTLLFGSVRWVDWSDFDISPAGYVAAVGAPLVSFDNDTFTWNIGVGRRFNDNWSGAVTVGWEKENGGLSSNLAPTDGNMSIGLGATYTQGPLKVTGGVRYIKIGNAQTNLGAAGLTDFRDNDAIAAGIKVGYSF